LTGILKSEWDKLKAIVIHAKEIIPNVQRNGYKCLNSYLQDKKLHAEDIERFSALSVQSEPSSLELTDAQLQEKIEQRTEEVREKCSESPEGKSCVTFIKTCTTRFRRWCVNISALTTNLG